MPKKSFHPYFHPLSNSLFPILIRKSFSCYTKKISPMCFHIGLAMEEVAFLHLPRVAA